MNDLWKGFIGVFLAIIGVTGLIVLGICEFIAKNWIPIFIAVVLVLVLLKAGCI